MENKINQNTSNSASNLHMRSSDPKVHTTFLSPDRVYGGLHDENKVLGYIIL